MSGMSESERLQTVADLRAARVIVDDRWYKGGLTDYHGSVCAVGAVNVATLGTVDKVLELSDLDQPRAARRQLALRVLDAHVPAAYSDFCGQPKVHIFNDAPGIVKSDVLDLFDTTIADLGGAL